MQTSWFSSLSILTNPVSQIQTKEALLAPELYRIDENLDIIFTYFESRVVSSIADQGNLYYLMTNRIDPEKCVGHFTLRKCKEKGGEGNHKPGESMACLECLIPYKIYQEKSPHYDKFLEVCKLCSRLFVKLFKMKIQASDFVDKVFRGVEKINKEIAELRKGTWGMSYAVSNLTSYWNGFNYGEGLEKQTKECKENILLRVKVLNSKVVEKLRLSDLNFPVLKMEENADNCQIWEGYRILIGGHFEASDPEGVQLNIEAVGQNEKIKALMKVIKQDKRIILGQIDVRPKVEGKDKRHLGESLIYHLAAEILLKGKEGSIVTITHEETLLSSAHDYIASEHSFLPPNEEALEELGGRPPLSWELSREKAEKLLEGKPRLLIKKNRLF